MAYAHAQDVRLRGKVVYFSDLVDEILRDVAPLKRKSTTELYFIYLGELKIELGHVEIAKFGRKEYMAWMRGFKQRKDRKTFFDYTKYLNIAFRYAYQEKYIDHWIKFPQVDDESGPRWRVLTPDEVSDLAYTMGEPLRTQFLISYECFMRLREMLHLTWDRIDFDERTILLRAQDVKTGKKQRRGRVVPMSPNVYAALKRLKASSTSVFVFPSPSGRKPQNDNGKSWARALKDAGIKGRVRWHDIRHTALTHAVMILKLPLADLSKVAGVSIKTLERVYLHHDVDHVRDITNRMNAFKKIA
jgi:integrase